MNREHVEELLYQTLEMEKGGIQVYETVLKCVVNDELKEEWGKYLEHWELIHEVPDKAKGEQREALKAAYEQSRNKRTSTCTTRPAGPGVVLGMPAALPPPEDEKEVKTAIGAARAKMARKRLL